MFGKIERWVMFETDTDPLLILLPFWQKIKKREYREKEERGKEKFRQRRARRRKENENEKRKKENEQRKRENEENVGYFALFPYFFIPLSVLFSE